MADRRIEILIERLLENTKDGKVAWAATVYSNIFQASFSKYAVRILTRQSGFATDFGLQLMNESGDLIEQIWDPELDQGSGAKTNYERLSALHTLARRRAMGYDDALDSILENLGDDIGKVDDPDTSSH